MELAHCSFPAVGSLSRNVPVVFPIGAVEQHSRHLSLFTDSIVVGEIARRASDILQDQVLFAPVMWLGNSAHHLDFSGTLTASPGVYLRLLDDLIECMIGQGFRRIVLLNGHGGNSVPAQQVLFEIRQRYRKRDDLLLLLANYWAVATQTRDPIPGLTQPQMQHACQWETSMMLALHPEWVGHYQDLEPVDYGNPFQPAQRSWVTQDISPMGHIGDPRLGQAEIGFTLLERYTEDVVALLRRVVEWDGTSWNG